MKEEIINNTKIKEEIFKKIESGELSMKPKLFFYFKIGVLLLSIFTALVVSSFLISYMLYSLRIGGQLYLLSYGSKGIYEFFMIFPWFVLVLDILLLFLIDWLIKSFRFGYNSPIIYLFLGTFMLITILGSLINFTIFNKAMMFRAEYNSLPIVSNYYNGIRRSHSKQGTFRGIVKSIEGNTFVLMHDDYDDDSIDDQVTVIMPEGLNLGKLIVEGDNVFLAGEIGTTSIVRAYGLTKIDKLD